MHENSPRRRGLGKGLGQVLEQRGKGQAKVTKDHGSRAKARVRHRRQETVASSRV